MEKGLQNGLKGILRDIDFKKKIRGRSPGPPSNERAVPPPLILSPGSRLAPLASSLWLRVPPVNNPSGSSPEKRKNNSKTCLEVCSFLEAFIILCLLIMENMIHYMGLVARKPVFGGLRTTQAQTSMHICAV